MADSLVTFESKPEARYLLAGWRRQWSNGGRISSGLPRYLIEKLEAQKIGEMDQTVSELCYPFQVAGTHDTHRPVGNQQKWDTFVKERSGGDGGVLGLPEQAVVAFALG
jgi:hypothetical protein